MKTLAAVLFLLLTFVTVANGQNDRKSQIEGELKNLVNVWDEAYAKAAVATLDKVLADEFTFVGGQTKAEYLASVKSRSGYTVLSAVSADIQIQIYGDTAVLTGLDTITIKNANQTMVTKFLYMDVWVKRNGRWQCVKTFANAVNR